VNAAAPDHTFSVSELNNQIKQILEMEFSHLWLEGEISNFKHHSSGHMYFSLKDAESEIRAVMWRGLNQSLRFRPEDGMQILMQGDVSVYTPRGQYQIIVNQMQPAGAGALQVAFEQLKAKLQEEGLFAAERKRPLPAYHTTVGVVTSSTGAAFRDILNVLERRAPYVRVILAPARVQGEGAAGEIVEGIRRLNRLENIDLIIIGRGGGSLEDLWPFNEEIVARAVVASERPVISAVGHEVDFSISDFCADYRAPTPSAAAEVVARDTRELMAELQGTAQLLQDRLHSRIDRFKAQLRTLENHYAFKIPAQKLATITQQVDDLCSTLERKIMQQLKEESQQLTNLEQQLRLLHPEHILERGYSVTRDEDGNVLKSPKTLKPGQKIMTQYHRGSTVSEVKSIGDTDE